ncbi:class I SAM-dependent methyltransferase [Paenibacillus allorhizosphaerae]|uniref:Ribosomal RNA small subunit methyltransferase C n=1 Tax=Paenibacillus allorhizosphaerae TaxID=2849866 RepID=A0ABN7TY35_9BACL|nr:class I SAM-dependent methyltransferase [Paenibacillus allorhizosphaerae]CAG7656732.1 Ribosomal RNA small subunit methyltransferase C [Paenibacillus allorhizosphaerae]
MSEHYYSQKPSTAHDQHTIEETMIGRTFTFTTDAGVFSKRGIDYGSKLLIETVSLPDQARVLDVGCGYGPIGLAAAVLAGKGMVTMVDINERAIELAKHNAKRNQITNVEILQSDLLEQVTGRTFDAVLTNPPIRAGKETVHRIFEQAHEVLVPGGALWIVIQKKQGAPSAVKKLESLFSEVVEVERDKGYWILKATK